MLLRKDGLRRLEEARNKMMMMDIRKLPTSLSPPSILGPKLLSLHTGLANQPGLCTLTRQIPKILTSGHDHVQYIVLIWRNFNTLQLTRVYLIGIGRILSQFSFCFEIKQELLKNHPGQKRPTQPRFSIRKIGFSYVQPIRMHSLAEKDKITI